MQGPSAAKGHQGELTRVVSALDRNYADGFLHLRFHDAKDSGCELFCADQWPLTFTHELRRARSIEPHSSTQKAFLVQPTKEKVGIGNGGHGSAAETDRARLRACRLRPYAQHTAGIE